MVSTGAARAAEHDSKIKTEKIKQLINN